MLTADDIALELRIQEAEREFRKQADKERWEALRELVTQRSANAVDFLERLKGLR